VQLWPRYFSNDLACVKKYQDKAKQKAIDQAAAAATAAAAAASAAAAAAAADIVMTHAIE
jgi:hypothetical protein